MRGLGAAHDRGIFWVISHSFEPGALWSSVPYGLTMTTELLGEHFDKTDDDRRIGILTLSVRFGELRARQALVATLVAACPLFGLLVLLGGLPWSVLLVMASLPALAAAVRVCARPRPTACPPGLPESAWPLFFVGLGIPLGLGFGSAFLVGLLLAVALAAWTHVPVILPGVAG